MHPVLNRVVMCSAICRLTKSGCTKEARKPPALATSPGDDALRVHMTRDARAINAPAYDREKIDPNVYCRRSIAK